MPSCGQAAAPQLTPGGALHLELRPFSSDGVAYDDEEDAANLAAAINASASALVSEHVTATSADNVVTITAKAPGASGNAITRNDSSNEYTTLAEYWTLGRRNGAWMVQSIEQRAEGAMVHLEAEGALAFQLPPHLAPAGAVAGRLSLGRRRQRDGPGLGRSARGYRRR